MAVHHEITTKPYRRLPIDSFDELTAPTRPIPRVTLDHRVLVVAPRSHQRLALVKELQRDCEVMTVGGYADALRTLREPGLVCAIVAHLDLGGERDALQMFAAARLLCPDTAHVLIVEAHHAHRVAHRHLGSRTQQTVIAPWHDGQLLGAIGAACVTCG